MSEYPCVERNGTRLVKYTDVEEGDWDVYIGRQNSYYNLPKSLFANPFHTDEFSRAAAVDLYKVWFQHRIQTDDEFRDAAESLQGQTLACWCVPDACHGEVILQWLDRGEVPDQELAFIQARFAPSDLDSERPETQEAIAELETVWNEL